MARFLTAGLLFILVASCANNPYAQFYQGQANARERVNYEAIEGDLQIYSTDDLNRDVLYLIRRGFDPIGTAFFNAGSDRVSEYQLREQAARVGAHVVVVQTRYTHSVAGAVPLVIPTTTTSRSTGTATAYGAGGTVQAYGSDTTTTFGSQTVMMPYSVARSDFGAVFLAKARQRVGIFPSEIDDETRRRLQTNLGIQVLVVVEGTSAFLADVLPGDILLRVNSEGVQSYEHYFKLLDKFEGQTVAFQFDRDGRSVVKQLEIRRVAKPDQQGATRRDPP